MASAQGSQMTIFPFFSASAVSRMPESTSLLAFRTFHPSRRSTSRKEAAEGSATTASISRSPASSRSLWAYSWSVCCRFSSRAS